MNAKKIVKIVKKQIVKWNDDPVDHIFLEDDKFNIDYNEEDTDLNNKIISLNFSFVGPPDTLWNEQMYEGKITFPSSFPFCPPEVKFTTDIFHPNIYDDSGTVCISILHEGTDNTGYEDDDMRWSPAQNLQSIMRSIQLLFDEPNCDSPANIDAAVMFRTDKERMARYIRNGTPN